MGALLSFACTKESKQRKVHPNFTAYPRSFAIFLTKIFELATAWLKQSENFLKIASRSGGSNGDPVGALFEKKCGRF
ncbi:hypothetical protein [Aggregatibacter kilianii]|uniref:hypothetical protein n=1 Tax=Aggregatibacter kilianii TaxID=2025884 RepID=UPI000D65C72F|nr:hypothetical protein [Aggregatibacter kilianii]